MSTEKIVWEADVECDDCKGTGIYQGIYERDGAGVICSLCDGAGKVHVKYEHTPFTERKKTTKVKRVYETAGVYAISSEDKTTPEGKTIHFSEAGVSYKEWLEGKKPRPIYDLHCPLEHFSQGTEIGKWLKNKGPCYQCLRLGSYISDCSKNHREECWKWLSSSKYAKAIAK